MDAQKVWVVRHRISFPGMECIRLCTKHRITTLSTHLVNSCFFQTVDIAEQLKSKITLNRLYKCGVPDLLVNNAE